MANEVLYSGFKKIIGDGACSELGEKKQGWIKISGHQQPKSISVREKGNNQKQKKNKYIIFTASRKIHHIYIKYAEANLINIFSFEF